MLPGHLLPLSQAVALAGVPSFLLDSVSWAHLVLSAPDLALASEVKSHSV